MSAADSYDELERVIVAPELQSALRLYRRLYLLYNDLDEAKAIVEELLRARLRLPRKDLPSPLLMALTTAVVVAYARPFVNTRGESKFAERSAPGSLLKLLTSRQREAHDYLVNIRNLEVAHSDAERSQIYLKLYPDGHGAMFRVARAPFLRSELKDIQRIITKLMGEVDRRCEQLRRFLPLEVWM